MKVAIIHYWLVGMRGGERVLEALCRLYPEADIFTHVYRPDAVSNLIRQHRVTTTFINGLPRSHRWYKRYLPLMPLALEQIDLRGYDLVISSESGPAKGVIPDAGALHVCYCHSPMRYIWNMAADYRASAGPVTRFLMPPIAHYIRLWDSTSAARVDSFVANSRTVSERIHKYYRRDARVIYPPVDVEAFERVRDEEVEDYYLMAGELVAYKRPDLAVEAFNRLGRKLVVIGGGEMLDKIRHLAGPSVRVLGPQPFAVLKHHYARARALIFPGEEDFGLVPVESMASGRPVIAYGRGGATETVRTGISGLFFHEQTQAAVSSAVEEFEAAHFNSDLIVEQARLFGPQRFVAEMQGHINVLLGAGR